MQTTFFNVLLVILAVVAVVLTVLYFLGRKLEKRQVEQQQLMEMSKQTVSMLVIDKKKIKAQGGRASQNSLRADA